MTDDTKTLTGADAALAPAHETRNLLQLFEKALPKMSKALPIAALRDEVVAAVIAESKRHPDLLQCTADSFIAAAIKCYQLGLRPGPAGHCYLIARRNRHNGNRKEINVQDGYKGLAHLAYGHPRVKRIGWGIVWEDEADSFMVDRIEGVLRHVVNEDADRTGCDFFTHGRYAYAYAMVGRERVVEVMNVAAVRAVRARSMSFQRSSEKAFWKHPQDHHVMVLKTVLRALLRGPCVPKTDTLATWIGEVEEADAEDERMVAADAVVIPDRDADDDLAGRLEASADPLEERFTDA